jgi:hypothetical protein
MNQDSGAAECDSASRSDSWVCFGGPLGKEGAPKKFLASNSRTRTRNPNANTATKHRINASKTRKRIAIPRKSIMFQGNHDTPQRVQPAAAVDGFDSSQPSCLRTGTTISQ